MLLQAYDEEDPDNAKRALNDPFIKHMDVEYAILARDLRLPQGGVVVQKKPIVENATDEYKRVRPQNDEVSLLLKFHCKLFLVWRSTSLRLTVINLRKMMNTPVDCVNFQSLFKFLNYAFTSILLLTLKEFQRCGCCAIRELQHRINVCLICYLS